MTSPGAVSARRTRVRSSPSFSVVSPPKQYSPFLLKQESPVEMLGNELPNISGALSMVVFTSEGGILIGNGELFVIHELRH